MVILSETTEKVCVKENYPQQSAKIRLVQHCAAISAIVELLLKFPLLSFCLSGICFVSVVYNVYFLQNRLVVIG